MEDDGLPVLPGFREIAQRRRRVIDELAGARRAAGLSQTEVAARVTRSRWWPGSSPARSTRGCPRCNGTRPRSARSWSWAYGGPSSARRERASQTAPRIGRAGRAGNRSRVQAGCPGRTSPEPAPPGRSATSTRDNLADQLWRRRVVLLSGRLDFPTAEAVIGRILLADADGPEPIRLHVHCPDGELDAAVVLAETLQLVQGPGDRGGQRLDRRAGRGGVRGGQDPAGAPERRFAFAEPRAAFHGRGSRIAAELELQAQQYGPAGDDRRGDRARKAGELARRTWPGRAGSCRRRRGELRLGLVHEIVARGG